MSHGEEAASSLMKSWPNTQKSLEELNLKKKDFSKKSQQLEKCGVDIKRREMTMS